MQFKIVTDSSCNLPDEMIEQYDLEILPLRFMVDGETFQSYRKGEKSDLAKFYAMMRAGKVVTTSLPNMAESEELVRGLLEDGNDVYYIGFDSAISGTYGATAALLDNLAAEYPDRKIFHTDTLSASGGQGILVLRAARLAEGGAPIEEVRDWVEANKMGIGHWFTVDDLMYLFRGGRVTRTSAWAGTLLNVKPVLHVDDAGNLIPMEKVMGRKKSILALLKHIKESATQPYSEQTVFINHGDCLEDAQLLRDKIKETLGIEDITIGVIDPVIGAHTGPGILALFFFANGR